MAVPTGLTWDDPAVEAAGAAVIVGAYAIEPARYARWLRRDVPHLAVVFGDAGVTVGPLVEPGAGPCLRCLDLHRTDSDAAWPAMAAQLFSLRRHGETDLVTGAVASVAVAAVIGRLRADRMQGPGPWTREVARFDPGTGGWTREAREPHPECGCQGLPVVSGGGTAGGRDGAGGAPTGNGDPVGGGDPATTGNPARGDDPAANGNPAATGNPARGDDPAATGNPARGDDPADDSDASEGPIRPGATRGRSP